MFWKKITFLLALLALALAVTACGGDDSGAVSDDSGAVSDDSGAVSDDSGEVADDGGAITADDILVFPGATRLDEGENQIADQIIDMMFADAEEGTTLEAAAYAVPEGTSWDEVRDYYDSELTSNGWVQGGIDESETLSQIVWGRGKQALQLMFAQDPISGEYILLFFLAGPE